ncbi:MAG: hypothetical protein AAF598_11510 [Bacteroidota bacterium]
MRLFLMASFLIGLGFLKVTASPKGKNTQELSYSVPFELVDNLIIVMANIDGQMGKFIFDTGAPELILNAQYYGQHTQQTSAGRLDLLKVSTLEFPKLSVLLFNMNAFNARSGIQLGRILGYGFLSRAKFAINYQKKCLYMLPVSSDSGLLPDRLLSF